MSDFGVGEKNHPDREKSNKDKIVLIEFFQNFLY